MSEKDDHPRFASRYKNEKIKSRNLSEKKRRDQFNMLINELSSMVPSTNCKMDKSSVLRSAILFLRTHTDYSVQSRNAGVGENWKPSFISNEEFTHLMLEAIDGFIIVLSCTGRILYSSESMASLLGYLPGKMCSSIFDMVHECDKASLYKLLSSASASTDSFAKDSHLSLNVHIKRGPMHSFQRPVYELVQLEGMFHHFASYSEGYENSSFECDSSSYGSSSSSPVSSTTASEWHVCFVAIAKLLIPQFLHVVNVLEDSKNEFTSRHSLEWTFLFLDHRAPPIIGYLPFEVLGTSGYEYYHVDDLENIAACHKALMSTGEGMSCMYRFLTKGQQWLWLQTRYYITYHQWNSKPEFIVCTHSVVNYDYVQDNLCKWPRGENFGKEDVLCNHTNIKSTINENCYPSSKLPVLSQQDVELNAAVRSLGERNSGNSKSPSKSGSYWAVATQQTNESEASIEVKETSSSTQLLAVQPSLFKTPSIPPVLAQQTSSGNMEIVSDVTTTTTEPFVELSRFLTTNIPEEQCQPTKVAEFQPVLARTPSQSHLHDYLKRRHQLLQQQIIIHQEELHRVSEQLKLVQCATPYHDVMKPSCQRTSAPADTSTSYHPHGDPVQQSSSNVLFSKDDGKCTAVYMNDEHQSTTTSLKAVEGGVGLTHESQDMSLCMSQEHSQVVNIED